MEPKLSEILQSREESLVECDANIWDPLVKSKDELIRLNYAPELMWLGIPKQLGSHMDNASSWLVKQGQHGNIGIDRRHSAASHGIAGIARRKGLPSVTGRY
jgi:hypothetical protein